MKVFLGEIATDRSDTRLLPDVDKFLTQLEKNSDYFVGWTIWAGSSNYPAGDSDNQSIFPDNGRETRPQCLLSQSIL